MVDAERCGRHLTEFFDRRMSAARRGVAHLFHLRCERATSDHGIVVVHFMDPKASRRLRETPPLDGSIMKRLVRIE